MAKSEWSELQLERKAESPYQTPFFVPSFVRNRIVQWLGLEYPQAQVEDIEAMDFKASNRHEYSREQFSNDAVSVLLATKLLSLQDPSALESDLTLQASICLECQKLNLGRIFMFRGQEIKTSRQFRQFQESSPDCACCKFIYESLVAEVAESKVTSIERSLETMVTIRSSEAFWHEIVCSLGTDIWAPEARITPVYLGAWPVSWPRFWSPSKAVRSQVHSDSALDQRADVLFDWLRGCASHPECQKESSTINSVLPDRVLDVDASPAEIRLREHEPGNNIGRYMALSYCWGKKSQVCLTKSTADSLKEGIALASLPQTIQDAVFLTRKLGCRYLWIDALCIIQDDAGDWQQQSLKMGPIYRNAHITLHASRAASVHDGFMGPRPPNEVYCGSINHKGYTKDMYLAKGYGYGGLEDFLKSEPLSSRGWAMQERALSRRKVFFGRTQMIWQCRHFAITENGTKLFDETQNPLIPDTRISDHSLWLRKISRYSRLSLTKPSDRLPAISGLANEFMRGSKDQYLAGHWKNSFISSLLWNIPASLDLKSASELQAPSWSWASVNSPIEYLPNTLEKEKATESVRPIAKLLEFKLDTSTTNPFGEVKSGYIDLQAPSLRVKLSDLRYKRETRTEGGFFEAFGLRRQEFFDLIPNAKGGSQKAVAVFFDFKSLEMADIAGLTALCVVLGRRDHRSLGSVLSGIIVVPTSQEDNAFRRIGMFDEMFDVVNTKTKLSRVRIL